MSFWDDHHEHEARLAAMAPPALPARSAPTTCLTCGTTGVDAPHGICPTCVTSWSAYGHVAVQLPMRPVLQ
jgi:hypothetical protein